MPFAPTFHEDLHMVVRLVMLLAGGALGALTLVVTRQGTSYSFAQTTLGGTTVLLVGGWAPMLAAALLPRRRLGPAALLFLTGAAWFVAEWDNPGSTAPIFTLALVCAGVAPAVVAHTVAVYGGLTRASRVMAVSGYAVTLGLQGIATALWFRPDPVTCDCPDNLIAIADEPARLAEMSRLGVWAGLVWSVAAAALLGWRLLSATRARLRATGAATMCGLAFLGLTAAYHARGLDAGLLGSDRTDRHLWVAEGLALMALGASVVADLARVRRMRRQLTGVVTGLRAVGGASDLRESLARRLGDPDLVIAYPVDDGAGYLDERGHPVDLDTLRDRETTPVRRGGSLLAVVAHRSGLDAREIDSLVSAVHLALDHERLNAQALAQLADLRASGARIVAAGDAERRRIERDLHDGAQQHLVALLLQIELLRARAPDEPGLADAAESLRTAADRLRTTARQLSTVLLDSAGLTAALAALAETRPLTVTAVPSQRLPPILEATVYLLAERASRCGPSEVAVTATSTRVMATLRVEGDVELGEVADRVTALDGQAVRLRDGGATILEVSLRLGAAEDYSFSSGA